MAKSNSKTNSSTTSGSSTNGGSQSASTSQTSSSGQSWGGSSSNTTSHTEGGSHSETSTVGGSHSETYGESGSTSQTQGGSNSSTAGKSWASGTVDKNTLANRDKYSKEWQQSPQVQQTYDRLQNTLNNKPGPFQSSYQDKLENLYNSLMGRDPFKYNFNEDPMYRMYRDQYRQQGRTAMQDTMGQAAKLTGGYGSSYAQTAAQQQYQSYLQQLNNVIPELRNQAYQEWKAEGEDLKDKYNLTNTAYNNEYQQYRNNVSDWQQDRSFDQSAYDTERNFDYSKYQSDRNYWNQEYWNERNAEQSNASNTGSTNWANSQQQGWNKSQTDSKNWSHSSTDTNSWSDTNSHTDSTNWANSLSNSATANNSVSNNWSNTNGWSKTNSSTNSSSDSGSGSGSSGNGSNGTWYKTSGANGKGLFVDGYSAANLSSFMRNSSEAQRSMMEGALKNAMSKNGESGATALLKSWMTDGYKSNEKNKSGKTYTKKNVLNHDDAEYLAGRAGIDLNW